MKENWSLIVWGMVVTAVAYGILVILTIGMILEEPDLAGLEILIARIVACSMLFTVAALLK
jgi:hypothetical protein